MAEPLDRLERDAALPSARTIEALATLHPSAVLRAPDAREEMYAGLVADLEVAAEWLAGRPAATGR